MKFSKTLAIISACLLAALFTSNSLADEKAKTLAAQCAMCHGQDGNSPSPSAPTIAGINEFYFKYTMDAYINGGRKSDMMKMFAVKLSKDDIDRLAKYYAKQTPKASKQEVKADLANKGKKLHDTYCEKCHANNGGVSKDGYGILSGQWSSYLKLTLSEYESGKRKTNPMMMTKLKKMQEKEGPQAMEQLLNFYASLK